jgi:3D (Asp-Asp-Asp) domain-containing protein
MLFIGINGALKDNFTTEENIPCEETKPIEVKTIEEPTIEEEPQTNYLGNFKATAYCACEQCCGKTDGITASGTKATEGRTIAVDTRKIPLGTTVLIDGNKYVAEDTGGAIKGNRIDIFFDSHTDALNFGVQYKDIYLY